MKKFKKGIIIFASLFLSGCTFYSYADRQIEQNDAVEETQVEEKNYEPLVTKLDQTTYYLYDQLKDEYKVIYDEVYDSLACMKDEVIVSTTDEAILKQIFDFVMIDHPEIFYVDGYQYTRYYVGDTVSKIGFIGNYDMDVTQVKENWKIINEVTDAIMTQMSDTEDEYYKAKYLYEYLIDETDYQVDCENDQNICSVFINKISVCQGYAKAYEFLLQKAGMVSALVSGQANGEGHAWNLARVNGNYYYVDPTWGDASYIVSEEINEVIDNDTFDYGVNYDYFLVTTKDIQKTHTFDGIELYPECTSMADNYYVREDLFLEEWDYYTVSDILNEAYGEDLSNITIKCSNEETYRTARNQLIDEKKIFDMLDSDTNGIAYAFDDNQLTFTIWF